MSEQQSQKRGARSEAQKLDDAREGHEPMGSTSRQDGAFGNQRKAGESDRDLALSEEQRKRDQK